MKTSIFSIAIVVLLFNCKNKNEFTIQGSFTGEPTEEWIYLDKYGETGALDSTKIINGKFTFKGEVDFPEIYGITYRPNKSQGIFLFFLEPDNLEIIIDLDAWDFNSSVSGGKVNDEYNDLRSSEERIMELYSEKSNANEDSIKEIDKLISKLSSEYEQQKLDYIKNHSESPISIFLYSMMFPMFSIEEQGEILESFDPAIKNTSVYKMIYSEYDEAISPEASTACLVYDSEIQIIESDLKDQPIIQTLLNQNPEKHLFVDIWGTWCGPCIEEIPSTRALKSTLDSTDIAFVYMCLDCEEDQWKNMIVKEDLKGLHYSVRVKNLTRFYNETGDKWRGVPKYLIINKDGNVVSGNAPKPSSGKLDEMLKNL